MATRILRKIETEGPSLDFRTISVEPLTPIIGAEIRGVDLSRPLSPEQIAEIRKAHAAHHVIYFRDQVLSNEDHKRFARLFGKLHVHPYHVKNAAPDHAKTAETDKAPFPESDPEILIVKADQKSKFVAGEGWHSDVTCDAEPPMGSMLYITQTPEIGGGDTMFASTVRAYEALSPMMKEILSRLTATHDGAKPYTGAYGTAPPPGRLAEDGASGRHHRAVERQEISLRQSRLHHAHQRARPQRKRCDCSRCSGVTSRAMSHANAA